MKTLDASDVLPFLGVPWQREENCWDFTRAAYMAFTGVDLPTHPAEALRGSHGAAWTPLQRPPDGPCVVGMVRGRGVRHAGVYLPLDGGSILHCPRPCSVITRVRDLERHGFTQALYYLYEDNHSG